MSDGHTDGSEKRRQTVLTLVDSCLLAALIQLYSATQNVPFAFAIGQVAVLGLMGFGLYKWIDALLLKRWFAARQRLLRQFVIGAYLITVVALPWLIHQARAHEQRAHTKFWIAHYLAEIHFTCDFATSLKAQHCSNLKMSEELTRVCQLGVLSLAPPLMKEDFQAALTSEATNSQMQRFRQQVEQDVTAAKSLSDYSEATMCKDYGERLSSTYAHAQTKLQALLEDLEN